MYRGFLHAANTMRFSTLVVWAVLFMLAAGYPPRYSRHRFLYRHTHRHRHDHHHTSHANNSNEKRKTGSIPIHLELYHGIVVTSTAASSVVL